MKKYFLGFALIVLLLPSFSFAGTGTGYVVDITIRRDLNIILVKTSIDSSASCATWDHQFAAPFDEAESKGIFTMLLSAMATNQLVRVEGTGSCYSGTNAEEIDQVNIGPWNQ